MSTTTNNWTDPLLRRGKYFLAVSKYSYFNRYSEIPIDEVEKHKKPGRRVF